MCFAMGVSVMHICHGSCRVQREFLGFSSLLPPYESWASNSCPPGWQYALLPADPSHWPKRYVFEIAQQPTIGKGRVPDI